MPLGTQAAAPHGSCHRRDPREEEEGGGRSRGRRRRKRCGQSGFPETRTKHQERYLYCADAARRERQGGAGAEVHPALRPHPARPRQGFQGVLQPVLHVGSGRSHREPPFPCELHARRRRMHALPPLLIPFWLALHAAAVAPLAHSQIFNFLAIVTETEVDPFPCPDQPTPLKPCLQRYRLSLIHI